MNKRKAIHTDLAPAAIGTYSQAICVGDLVFISGQLPLLPNTMELDGQDIETQTRRVFLNLAAIAEAAGADLNDAVKINISMIDLAGFAVVNTVMADYFSQPYPARACVQVAALPKNALIEIEATLGV
ncbi:Rid family detoxifying hydrolase [bacterium]|jgi:reactive intermediate/imine deaminase|nr:Rid family detoxifying hydrolase [Pseudomonadales bacterium]MDB4404607.1 Rid family detoxifying hydrolase [bacterium]